MQPFRDTLTSELIGCPNYIKKTAPVISVHSAPCGSECRKEFRKENKPQHNIVGGKSSTNQVSEQESIKSREATRIHTHRPPSARENGKKTLKARTSHSSSVSCFQAMFNWVTDTTGLRSATQLANPQRDGDNKAAPEKEEGWKR